MENKEPKVKKSCCVNCNHLLIRENQIRTHNPDSHVKITNFTTFHCLKDNSILTSSPIDGGNTECKQKPEDISIIECSFNTSKLHCQASRFSTF